jgi:hypothetical protein
MLKAVCIQTGYQMMAEGKTTLKGMLEESHLVVLEMSKENVKEGGGNIVKEISFISHLRLVKSKKGK